jgi:hypothetical protein
MELTVGSRWVARGCLQQILADLSGMSMPADESSTPQAFVPDAEVVAVAAAVSPPAPPVSLTRPRELGGRVGPEPTRFGDWEKNGRCIDF